MAAHRHIKVVDLPLTVGNADALAAVEDSSSSAPTQLAQTPYFKAVAAIQLDNYSFMDDPDRLKEASNCIINANFAVHITEGMRAQRDALASKIPARLRYFKSHRLMDAPHLIHNFALNFFEENIKSISELIVLSQLVSKSVNVNKSLHGIALLHDRERGIFVKVVKVDGTADEQSFQKEYTQLEKDSQQQAKKFARLYPSKRPRNGVQGEANGVFSVLEMFVAIAIHPKKNNDCLTREENGIFLWSERTMTMLRESKKGSDTLPQKQMKLVMCALGLYLNLMLDKDENLSEGSFVETFMGAFNLVKETA